MTENEEEQKKLTKLKTYVIDQDRWDHVLKEMRSQRASKNIMDDWESWHQAIVETKIKFGLIGQAGMVSLKSDY